MRSLLMSEGSDLRADGRNRGRADDIIAGRNRRRAQLGLSLLLAARCDLHARRVDQGGYLEEARAWREWLLRAIAGTPAQMQILYGVRGERRIDEFELPWLKGYENSRPVRIGNAASTQFQLDVYGEIVGSIYEATRAGLKINEEEWRIAGCAPEISRIEMEGAGRRNLGSARPATSFHAFESHGVVRVRSRRAHGRGIWL